MKKLRLTEAEKQGLLEDFLAKFITSGSNPNNFEYTKKDMSDYLDKNAKADIKKPTLYITADAYTTMYELVKQSSVEIQWHMMVTRNLEDQIYTIYDVLLFPQTNSGTSTTSDQNEFAAWQMALIQNIDFPIEELRGHGHSHVNMNVYSSGIDDAYQTELITKVEDGDFYIFLVLNKKMEMYALIYDFAQQMIFETKDIDIKILTKEGIDIKEWCTEQIKTYCKSYSKPKYGSVYKPRNPIPKSYPIEEEDYIANIPVTGNFFGRRK